MDAARRGGFDFHIEALIITVKETDLGAMKFPVVWAKTGSFALSACAMAAAAATRPGTLERFTEPV